MTTAKKQHYVPQFLLNNFCKSNSGQIHVIDKHSGREWVSPPRDVASQNKFYDFIFEGFEMSFEESLSQMEAVACETIKKIIASESLSVISDEARIQLAYFIAVQYLRTPHQIEKVRNIDRLFIEMIESSGARVEDVENFRPIKPEDEKLFHARTLTTEPHKLAPILLEKEWCLHKTTLDDPFLIGDSPVALQNIIDAGPRGNLGLKCYGIEIYLPLSNTLTLALLCPDLLDEIRTQIEKLRQRARVSVIKRKMYKEALADAMRVLEPFDGSKPYLCRPENVENLNSLQVRGAERFVYCGTGRFDLVTDMIAKGQAQRHGPRMQRATYNVMP